MFMVHQAICMPCTSMIDPKSLGHLTKVSALYCPQTQHSSCDDMQYVPEIIVLKNNWNVSNVNVGQQEMSSEGQVCLDMVLCNLAGVGAPLVSTHPSGQ